LVGVVGFGWVEEEKREQRRKERYSYIKQPGLLLHLHLKGMISRHAEVTVARHKPESGVKWAVSEAASCRRLHVSERALLNGRCDWYRLISLCCLRAVTYTAIRCGPKRAGIRKSGLETCGEVQIMEWQRKQKQSEIAAHATCS
jgi:hypothetical protein